MSESKAAFRRRLGRLLNVLTVSETSDAGTTTTLIAESLLDTYSADGTMAGAAVYDLGGSEWRLVEDWAAATAEATFTRAFSTSMASGRDIEVYEQFTPEHLDNALRMALDEAYAYIVIDIVDESNEVEEDVYEYPIPDNIRDFSHMAGSRVSVSFNEDVDTFPRIELTDWTVRTDGESQTLVLPSVSGLIGRTLRLVAKGVPTFPSADSSLIPLRSDTLQLLAFKSAEIAWRTGPRLTGKDAEFAAAQEIKWAARFDEKKDEWGTALYPAKWKPDLDTPFREYPLAYFHREPS